MCTGGVQDPEQNVYHTALSPGHTHMTAYCAACPQSPKEGGIDGGLRLGKQAELEKLIAVRDAHKNQEREKKVTARYHKVREALFHLSFLALYPLKIRLH